MSLLVAKAKEQVAGCVLNAAKSAMEKGILNLPGNTDSSIVGVTK